MILKADAGHAPLKDESVHCVGDARLYLGDAIEIMAGLPDASVDFIFTDPPWGHNNNDGDLIANWEKALGRGDPGPARPIPNDGPEANDLVKKAFREFNRLLASGGCCCCGGGGGGGGPDPQFARWALWLDEAVGLKQMIVWDKGQMGMGWHYRRSYETILVGQKRGGPCRWYDMTDRIENIIRPGHCGIKKIIPRQDQHPTEKPRELAAFFIGLHSRPGDVVLDPFMGHGSTGIAAVERFRKFIGVEIDPAFFRAAVERITDGQKQMPLFDEMAAKRTQEIQAPLRMG